MQKHTHILFLILALFLLVLGCSNPEQASAKTRETKRPVSIYHGNSSTTMESYQATVKSYYQNNRSPNPPELRTEFRLSLKVIDGVLRSRIDIEDSSFPDKVARSIISDGTMTLVVKTASNEVEQRIAVSEEQKKLNVMADSLQSMGRIDLASLRAVAARLSFDITDHTPGLLTVNVPPATMPPIPGNARITRYKLSFDTTDSVLRETEMLIAEQDGTVVTVTTVPVYQQDGENLIKVGEQMVISRKIPGTIDMTGNVVQEYATIEDIPTVSASELADLQAKGLVSRDETSVVLGDLSDPSYKETQTTVYEEVKINTIADMFFRMNY